jgi:TPP-dependent pyruvate/acetoin dehydrogenase alpha subunit
MKRVVGVGLVGLLALAAACTSSKASTSTTLVVATTATAPPTTKTGDDDAPPVAVVKAFVRALNEATATNKPELIEPFVDRADPKILDDLKAGITANFEAGRKDPIDLLETHLGIESRDFDDRRVAAVSALYFTEKRRFRQVFYAVLESETWFVQSVSTRAQVP